MAECGAEVNLLASRLDITIGAGIPLSMALTFTDSEGDPYDVDVADVVAVVAGTTATVAQTSSNIVTVSLTAEQVAAIDAWSSPWSLSVSGVTWLTGRFDRTTRPGCSTAGATIVVPTAPVEVTVTVGGDVALAAQLAALTFRLDALGLDGKTVLISED